MVRQSRIDYPGALHYHKGIFDISCCGESNAELYLKQIRTKKTFCEGWNRGRSDSRSQGRSLLCKWMVEDLGKTQREVGELLGVSNPAVSQMKKRGVEIEKEEGVDLGLGH